MSKRLIHIILFISVFQVTQLYGQPAGCATSLTFNCDGWPLSRIEMDQQAGGSLMEFVFDDLSDYNSGMTYYGTTILRVTASDTANSDCNWQLKLIANNGGLPTPAGEWLQTASYGSSGAQPTIALMEVRVTNNCATSPLNGAWQTFPLAVNGDNIVLINDGIVNLAGTGGGCGGGQTNSEGSYLTSYGEFSFVIDYRIRPFFNYTPGKYELNIKFCLTEGTP